MQGWISLHRILLEKPIWKKSTPEQKTILITLLLMANYKGSEWEWGGEKFKIYPGQMVTSLESIAEKCGKGITIQNVRTAIKKFEKYEFLTNKSTKTGRLITIVNWRDYQEEENIINNDDNKDLTNSQQRPNKDLTPNNNDNNDNNDNKNIYSLSPVPYEKITELYNTICKSLPKIQKTTDKRKRTIKARWSKSDDLSIYTELFKKAEESDFLSGRNGKWTGCNFDWLMNENNMVKVLEGSYDNKEGPSTTQQPKTRFHNFEQRTAKYTPEQLEEIARKRREARG